MAKRLKVLVSAYACSPLRGSEPGMGWGFVEAISQHHDLWVITEQEKWQADIEAELERRPDLRERIKFCYIRKHRGRTLRKIWPPSYYWFYRDWQKKAKRLAEQLHQEVGFDLAHQLNMVGFREPGYLWQLDIPFVWGPIGGSQNVPWRFLPTMGFKGAVYYGARNLINRFQQRFLPRPRKAAQKAGQNGLIAATTQDLRAAKKYWGVDAKHVICEVGPPPMAKPVTPAVRRDDEPLRIVWSGLHIPRKALNLLLHSLQKLPHDVVWTLDILGEGPCTKKWQARARKLGVDQHCTWHGWVPRDKAVEVMTSGHLFVITSLQDLTSTVTLEALASGLPIICFDHCGFADVVTEDNGVRVPLTTPNCVVEKVARAIVQMQTCEKARTRWSENAVIASQHEEWWRKSKKIKSIYKMILSRTL